MVPSRMCVNSLMELALLSPPTGAAVGFYAAGTPCGLFCCYGRPHIDGQFAQADIARTGSETVASADQLLENLSSIVSPVTARDLPGFKMVSITNRMEPAVTTRTCREMPRQRMVVQEDNT